MRTALTNQQIVTPKLVRSYIKHAQTRKTSNHPSGRLMESWKCGRRVLLRYTFWVDEQNCPGVEQLLDILARESQK